MTNHIDASKITWNGECLDGKVDGEGTLTIYKNDTLFYEFKGVCRNGAVKKGEILWANDSKYINSVWLKIDKDGEQALGIIKNKNSDTIIGELVGFDDSYRIVINQDGIYICGIVNTKSNLWTSYISVEAFENYFRKNYTKDQYEHFIPVKLPKRTIAITYFDNTSGDPSYDPLIKGLADMLISDLSGIESVNIVEREKLDAILKEIDLGESKFIDSETAHKMGKGLGAQYILTGSFIVMGDDFRIDARFVNVGNGEIVFSKAVDGNKETFFNIEKGLAKEIISKLELSHSNLVLSDMEDAGTRSIDAYLKWIKGGQFFNDLNYDSARIYFEKSLSYDNNFTKPLDAIIISFNNQIILEYPPFNVQGYYGGFYKYIDQVNQINDISVFIDYYQFLKIRDLEKTILGGHKNEYAKMREYLCQIIQFYYCNDTKKISGSNLCGKEENENALIWARNRYLENPTSWNCQNYGFFLYQVANDNETAMNIFMQAIELDSTSSAPYYSLLVILQKFGNDEDYIKYGKRFLQLEPNRQGVYFEIASSYHRLGDYSNAIKYYKEFCKKGDDPSFQELAYMNIGVCYFNLKEYKNALEYLLNEENSLKNVSGESLEFLDKPTQQYWYISYSYYFLESYEKSILYREKLIDLMIEHDLDLDWTDLSSEYSDLAELYKKNENYDKMHEALLSSKDHDPENWLAWNNLCEYYMITKEYDKALIEIKTSMKLAPELPNAYDTMGDLQLEMGNEDEALEYYFKGIQVDSIFSQGLYHIAVVYEKQKHPDYIGYYQKAKKLGNAAAELWVMKNKRLIDEHNNKSKKAPAADYIEELKKLAELKSLGIITNEEFEAKKKELLGL